MSTKGVSSRIARSENFDFIMGGKYPGGSRASCLDMKHEFCWFKCSTVIILGIR